MTYSPKENQGKKKESGEFRRNMVTKCEVKNRVLMVAFHFPPFRGSSGSLRTVNFSRYLPQFGCEPIVLTAHPRAYPDVDLGSLTLIPSQVTVKRAFALDAARHLSWKGKHLDCTAIPDRWGSWLLGAIPTALQLIRQWSPRVIWSTYPISTAHVIGAIVHCLTGLPWIADFRDPMVGYDAVKDELWPQEPSVRKIRTWIERLVMKYSARTVFVSEGTLQTYAKRFPYISMNHWTLIPNGYDEENFSLAEKIPFERKTPKEQMLLLHSGSLYPGSGRETTPLFAALVDLRNNERVSAKNLKIVLRASVDETNQQRLIKQYGLEEIVFLAPPIPYVDALAEMLRADGLLLFQGASTSIQIPAKVYEYLRAQRPIFALVDPAGDAAALLRRVGVREIEPIHDKERIAVGLEKFLTQLRLQTAPMAAMSQVIQFSRQSGTQDLARLLDEVR